MKDNTSDFIAFLHRRRIAAEEKFALRARRFDEKRSESIYDWLYEWQWRAADKLEAAVAAVEWARAAKRAEEAAAHQDASEAPPPVLALQVARWTAEAIQRDLTEAVAGLSSHGGAWSHNWYDKVRLRVLGYIAREVAYRADCAADEAADAGFETS